MTGFPNLGNRNSQAPIRKGVTGVASLRPKLPRWATWGISKSQAKMVGHERGNRWNFKKVFFEFRVPDIKVVLGFDCVRLLRLTSWVEKNSTCKKQ